MYKTVEKSLIFKTKSTIKKAIEKIYTLSNYVRFYERGITWQKM